MRFFLVVFLCFTVGATAVSAQNLAEIPIPNAVTEPSVGLFDIPDAYIKEAELYMRYCQAELKLRRHYDCECLAAKFLDERITVGPEISRAEIANNLKDQCQDASEAAAGQYTSCLGNRLLLPDNIDPMVYCTCYANEFARIFEDNQLVVGPGTMTKVQSRAHVECRKPGFAERRYSDKVPALPPVN